eukprot:Rhum_TRINITY_DN14705_c32_g1::Rhum_TRINITY_DN14705_c32_g1_i1::g.112370::m.112370/K09584/PDIA6, TXNDC7; protein disulfide-isomerase A6
MASPSAAAKMEGPGEPHFKLPKNAVAPFDMAALVDVDRVYANPGDISLEVNAKLVQRLTYARFTAEGVAAADAGKVAHLMRVLQMLFDASESDNDHYAEQLNLCQEEMAALRLAKQEDEQLRQVNADLEMRLRHRADRIAELEAEAAAKQAAKQEADSLRQRLFQLQGETEKLRITSEEYRKTAEGKLQRAADFESKSRKGTRETDRDVRALRAVVQQSQEEVEQLGRTCQQHQANEVSLRQELHVLAAKEKTLMAMLDEAKAEAEQLKIRLEERDDQCLSLEKHAVEDLKTFRGKAAQLQSEKDRLIERLQRDAQQQQESVALFKQEVHDARRLLSEAQQQTEDMAEKAALKEKECRQLRAVVERERSSRIHDSQQTGFVQASPQPGGGGGGGGSQGAHVVELTDANFAETVTASKDLWLVEFYAPWCGHCKNLAPEWEAAAKDLQGSGASLGAVDATVHQQIAGEHKVQGYPTIKVFSPQGTEEYNGPRSAAGIVDYALGKLDKLGMGMSVEEATSPAAVRKECLEKKNLCVVAILPHVMDTGASGRNEYIQAFEGAAKKVRSRMMAFTWVSGGAHEAFESAFGVQYSYPTFVAINSKKNRYVVHQGAFSESGIVASLRKIEGGRAATKEVKVKDVAASFETTTPWDGKDYTPPADEYGDL